MRDPQLGLPPLHPLPHRDEDDARIEKLHKDAVEGKLRAKRRDRGVGLEDSESEEPTASRTGKDAAASGTEDEDEDEESEEGDDENAGWSVAAPLAVLVPAVVLGFAM